MATKRTVKRNVKTPNVRKPPARHVVFNANTPRINTPRFVMPVGLPENMFTITQGFDRPVDYSNLNPDRYQRHEGVDFAPIGSARDNPNIPVVAVQNARVTQVRTNPNGYGRYVRIEFDDGNFGALYAHLENIAVNVGDHVNAGDVIGTMGNSGRSTGRHLHFNLLDLSEDRGNYIYPQVINPMPFLTGAVTQALAPIPRSTQPKPNDRPVQIMVRGKPPTQDEPTGDYPTGMPGTSGTPLPATEQAQNPTGTLSGYGLPPMFQTGEVNQPTLSTYDPDSIKDSVTGIPSAILGGIFAQGLNEKGEFDLLQAIGLGTGDEREEYVKQYAPYIVLALVGIALILVGVARLVFNPNPLK